MSANLKNLSSGHRTENVSFLSSPKEGQWQRMLHTTLQLCWFYMLAMSSSKIFQARLQCTRTKNFWMYKLGLEKAEGPEIKLLTSVGSYRKQGNSRNKVNFCFIDYAKVFDCVDHNKLWEILQELGVPAHHTCLLRNLYACQEAIVRSGHGTMDWFKTGKGMQQAVYCHSVYLTSMKNTSC